MKNKWFNIAIAIALISVISLNSCSEKVTKSDQLSMSDKEALTGLLELKSTLKKLKSDNGIFGNLFSFKTSFIKMQAKTKAGKLGLKSTNDDSTYWDDDFADWYEPTCAEVTEYTDEEGNFVSIYDYGDGCTEYDEMVKGKITYIWSESENFNEYYSKVIYEDYFSYDMLMNGYSEYTFTQEDFEGETENQTDSLYYCFSFEGTTTCAEEIEMIYNETEKVVYSASYAEKWDATSYTVLEGYFNYSDETENIDYSYKVLKDLFTDFNCDSDDFFTYVPVSGIEEIMYSEGTISEEFTLDYGNGTCDNLATMTKDGETFEVDFGDLWEECWEDEYCENDSIQ